MLTLKRREIISMFRSLQERIVNYMHAKSENKLIELPNIIFYKANKEKKLFNEIDRIITVKEDIQIDEFLVYLKAEFSPGNKNNIKIDEMENLAKLYLKKDSCNYIEIKSSISTLFEKEEKDNDKKSIEIKSPSDKSSGYSR